MNISDPHLLELFVSSIDKNTSAIDAGLLELENQPENTDIINELMRSAHNIKGTSNLVGFAVLKDLSHSIENVMIDISAKKLSVSQLLISTLLKAEDLIKVLKNDFITEQPISEITGIISELEKLRAQQTENQSKNETPKTFDIDPESLSIYISDLEESIENINSALLQLEKNVQDKKNIESIMRFAHNIKGSSSMVGFTKMKELTHAIETIMSDISKDKIKVTSKLISTLLKALDTIINLKNEFKKGNITTDTSNIINELIAVSTQSFGSSAKDSSNTPIKNKEQSSDKKINILQKSDVKIEPVQQVKFNIKSIENMINLTRELTIVEAQLTETLNSMAVFSDASFTSKINQSVEMIFFMGKSIRLIQDEFMKSKMTPFSILLKNFPRMVRDLENSLNKKINLVIETSGTRLDQNIAEEITNPLIHIVRNSADHGIECPKERIKSNKPEVGTIKIYAYQKSEQIIITIEDDGKGIDEDQILSSAISKGLVSRDEAPSLSKSQIINYIFHPGFSTSKNVTEISGRGVGMDVVKEHIKKVNGTIELSTEKGKGTKIMLRIPSTMTIIPSVISDINGKILCIPAINVVKVLYITPSEIKEKDQTELLIIDGMAVPLIRLHSDIGGNPREYRGKYYAVVIGLAEKKIAILVDKLLKEQKIVVKPFGEILCSLKNLMGTTILEDGKIGFVLNVSNLVSNSYAL